MKYPLFIEVPLFTKKLREIGFNEIDLQELQNSLIENPYIGKLIVGTGGIRKHRVALKGRSKSRSARLCYLYYDYYQVFVLVTIYTKKEKDNLSQREKDILKKLSNDLLTEIKGRFNL